MEFTQGNHHRIHVAVLGFVTLVIGLPLLFGRVLAGHDIVVYLVNAQQTAANLRIGEMFPAWGGGFNAGYGAPTLLFFPPLTSYLHAIPLLLGIPVVVGVCAWSLIGHFLSGLAMHGWLRSIGFRHAVLPAAIVYMLAPYRLVDLYHRSALAEHWSFLWPPLILWVGSSGHLRPCRQIPLLAVLVAALLLTNIPLAVLFGFGLGGWFFLSKRLRQRRLPVVAGVILGFALASFAIVPQALSSSLLAIDRFYGPQAGPFRPSANTLFSGGFRTWDFNAEMSVVVVATFALAVLAFLLLPPVSRKKTGTIFTLVGAVVCVLAATPLAGKVWDFLPVFSKLQFPWRVASLLTMAAAVLVASVERRRAWLVVLITVGITLPFSGWSLTLPFATFSSPESPQSLLPGTEFPDPYTAWEAGSSGAYWRHENLAEIWFLAKNLKPFLIADLAGKRAPQLDGIRKRPAILLEDSSAEIRVQVWNSVERSLEISSLEGGTVLWRAISFPEMHVTVDERVVAVFTDEATGLLAHVVPAGKHTVHWVWRPFSVLRWARLVSFLALLGSIVLFLRGGIGFRTESG